ncbi:MAG: hypothetical protein QNJ90_06390 [Planctomycetota bacterium]|nr:hypothetical protein [Planctomycetota bacterium]
MSAVRVHLQWLRAAVLLGALAAGACGGGGGPVQPDTPNLRPESAPDIVLLSVSGRCGVGILCSSPEDNEPYLGYAGGAAEAVEEAFRQAGYTTDAADFIASLYSYDDDADGAADRRGFLELLAELDWIQENWIADFENPTRIVIVAHSHGCVWAHIAAGVRPDVPIAYLISLDGNCLLWEFDYPPDITAYFSANGNPWSWDIRDPCDRWDIPGLSGAADTEDVAWPNVDVNLEVRSNDPFGIEDVQLNYRPDGTRTRIDSFASVSDDHSGVHDPTGESMAWVLQRLQELGY